MTSLDVLQSTQKDVGAGTSTTLAFTTNVKAGSVLILFYRLSAGGTALTASDNLNGSWTKETEVQDGNLNFNGVAWVANSLAGACTVSVSWTGSVTFRMAIVEVSGLIATSPRDQYNTAAAANVTSQATGSITTTQIYEIVFTSIEVSGTATWTQPTGYTKVQFVPDSASSKLGVAYKALQVIATENPSWSFALNTVAGATISFIAKQGPSFQRNILRPRPFAPGIAR